MNLTVMKSNRFNMEKTLKKQFKGYIDTNLNLAKVNVRFKQRPFYSATEYQINSREIRNF